MADEPKPALVALRDRREAVIATLENGYASSLLDDVAFEDRIARAHAAADIVSLDALVNDLESVPSTALVPRSTGPALVPISPRVTAILGSVERRGEFGLPQSLEVRATLGSTVIDLRDAQLFPGESTIHIKATLGSVEIIVPPELAVVTDVSAILGSVEHRSKGAVLDVGRPVLRVVGRVVLGSVEIKVRPRGAFKAALAQLADAGRKLLGS
jgi:hypothetical protein